VDGVFGTYNVSMVKKSQAMIVGAWAVRNSRQVGPQRRGTGSSPAFFRICHPVEVALLH
jgi:hypothetical protein